MGDSQGGDLVSFATDQGICLGLCIEVIDAALGGFRGGPWYGLFFYIWDISHSLVSEQHILKAKPHYLKSL